MSDLRKLILDLLAGKGEVRTAEIVERSGFSRAYVQRILKQLQEEGHLRLIGRANRARYVAATRERIEQAKGQELRATRILKNERLEEDRVLEDLQRETGILGGLAPNVRAIVEYAFLEMLNNAIEHSRSKTIRIRTARQGEKVSFLVRDFGIGIFHHIMETRSLKSEVEAIQDLLKGKQTTDPERHSGEGIFFTSRSVDMLTIKSDAKRLIFDNIAEDAYIKSSEEIEGTEVQCSISTLSPRSLTDVFARYSGEQYEFGKTEIAVELFVQGAGFASRSQARRILAGLEKFSVVVLDFRNVETIGQGFADEVFRVWKKLHPDKRIEVRNANQNVQFMIDHVRVSS